MERLIIEQLYKHKDIHDWTLTRVCENETQLYLIGEALESLRRIDSTKHILRIFNRHDGLVGDSAITILESDSGSLNDKLNEGVFMASIVANPPYKLPLPGVYPHVYIKDEGLGGDKQTPLVDNIRPFPYVEWGRSILFRIREEVHSAITRCGVRLSSLEAYITEAAIGLKTSSGIDLKREESVISVDMVLLSKDGKEESEKHFECTRRRLKDINLRAIIDENAKFAFDSLKATLPETGEFPVVVSRDALVPFFSPFIFHASGNARYKKLSRFEKGESVFGKDSSNRLTLKGSTVYPFGNNSSPFDEEGLPGSEVTVIEDGRFLRNWATKRFADWLGIEPTGPFGNIIIEPGDTPINALLKGSGTVYHIVEFSWMNPDPVTGKFTGEIRLGYKINGNRISPVKGGSVTGNVFEAMGESTFSKEEIFLGNFVGPEAIRFERLSIAGS